jgi:lysophospholipase L1-like esterase
MFLRFKNADMKNYDIEMWKYSNNLKTASTNPGLGHVHRPNQNAVLQSVEIRTNAVGLRGKGVLDRGKVKRRILMLGSSITLGWGVSEKETTAKRLQSLLGGQENGVEVLNAGVGNYNGPRYVTLFFEKLQGLKADDILVHYFLRDAEVLEQGGGNLLLQNSQLAVTLWIAFNRVFQPSKGKQGLIDHYQSIYKPEYPGFKNVSRSLARLAQYAKINNRRLYLAITPDFHFLDDYPFNNIHAQVAGLAENLGYKVVDLLPAMQGLRSSEIWAMAGDPHPNARGHELMAKAIANTLMLEKAR